VLARAIITKHGKPLHVFAHAPELENGTAVATGEGVYVFGACHLADLGKGGVRKSLRLLKGQFPLSVSARHIELQFRFRRPFRVA
jgi:hypothetical protein